MADRRDFFCLAAASVKWGVPISTIVGWAAKGRLRLCTGIAYADADGAPMAGLVEISGADIMSAFRLNAGPAGGARVFRLRVFGTDCDWRFVSDAHGDMGIEISAEDIFISAEEFFAFEGVNDLGAAREKIVYRNSEKHDWQGMYVQLCKRIFEQGLPESLAALTREMQNWFLSATDGSEVPDESTIRRRLQPVWNDLRGDL